MKKIKYNNSKKITNELNVMRQAVEEEYEINLPKEQKLEKLLRKEIAKHPDKKKALLYIEIDNFDSIKHVKGYNFAGKLMEKIIQRIKGQISPNHKLYINSGESFSLFIDNYHDTYEVIELGILISQSFSQAFMVDGSRINLSIKIGLVLYPKYKGNSGELISHAKLAIYRGKQIGRHRIWLCDCEKNYQYINDFVITQDLYDAVENKDIELFYQPQLDLQKHRITGFEALSRWKHPRLGNISPATFIRVAEETGLIVPMGEQVLIDACLFIKKIHNQGYKDMAISINVSAIQFLDSNFYDDILNVLELINLEPHYLELEITESMLIQDYKTLVRELKKLRDYGVKIAIDDFGQGYSSLAYLRKLPIDILKIDKVFSDDILEPQEREEDNLLIDSIIILGKNMGFTVLAEGVEKKRQMDYLKEKGCHKVQGYYIGKPAPEKEAIDFLQSFNRH